MTRGPEAPRGARKRTQKTLNYEAEQQSRWFQRAVELNLAPLAAVAHAHASNPPSQAPMGYPPTPPKIVNSSPLPPGPVYAQMLSEAMHAKVV